MDSVTNEALDECVNQVLDSDRTVNRLTKGILRLQGKLRREVDDRAWRTYMRLEAMVNYRQGEILQKVFDRLGRRSR